RRQVHVADVHALPPADPETYRRENDVLGPVVRDADTADVIQAPFDPAEALEYRLDVVEVVDQHERLRGAAADVESERRPPPIHLRARAVLVVQRAVSIAEPDADRAAAFLALDVGVRRPVVVEHAVQNLRDAAGAAAEEGLGLG